MDIELVLERLKELASGTTQLTAEHPFEFGIFLGALGMATIWWLVSVASHSKNDGAKGHNRSAAGVPSIEEVREKARRRL